MIREVTPPTPDDLAAAREIVARYLTPTPTVALHLRGRQVFAKLESLQTTGAFKIRGGLSAVEAARRENPEGSVITSSAGNHGLGIAHAAKLLNVRATVVVPANASPAKVRKLQKYDIELIQWGSSYDDAQDHAHELSASRGVRYISPFNDTHVIAGQATIFDEMIAQAPSIEHLIVPVGGGGLISGIVYSRAAHDRLDVRITGVQPENSAAMYHVLRGTPMNRVQHTSTIADGLAGGGVEGALTNDGIAQHHIPLVLVPEDMIRGGVREAAEVNGLVLEGSAATPYAAITRELIDDPDSQLGFIASGRNIASDLFGELLAGATL